jgi:predicted dehydrogenase
MTAASARPPVPTRRRYALVGLGSRQEFYQDGIEVTHAAAAELVAVCDVNPGRIELARARSATRGGTVPRGYLAAEFSRLLAEARPDVVIVTTPDAAHAEYVVAALEAGCEVVTEKPMTTDADACRRILDACRRTERHCRVAFNYRYSPARTQVKDLLLRGTIGEVLSVDFHWLLNTHHGADYFRRWHACKDTSGGLLVHKATHHFDLVNWWLGAVPVAVSASGARRFYTPETARRLGLGGPHERCLNCPVAAQCPFHLDLAVDPRLRALYLETEAHDGYLRDRCVFRADIDIEDTMSASVTYDSGALLTYSLNAYNAWEGCQVAFNGTEGRIEHTLVETVYREGREAAPTPDGPEVCTRVIPLRGAAEELTPWRADGDHGGGDRLMLEEILAPGAVADPYLRRADERAGAASMLVGVAANRSLATGVRVRLADLAGELPRPDYPVRPPAARA